MHIFCPIENGLPWVRRNRYWQLDTYLLPVCTFVPAKDGEADSSHGDIC